MNKESQFGEKYSEVYDLLYREKDYIEEANFVSMVVQDYSDHDVSNILSIGCGTCSPDINIAKLGYKIFGIDLSTNMLNRAKFKINNEGLNNNIDLFVANGNKLPFHNQNDNFGFDSAISLFNVSGYWKTDEEADQVFKEVGRVVKSGSVFLFDGWHEDAVLKNKPEKKIKTINNEGNIINRYTEVQLEEDKQIINIRFSLRSSENNDKECELVENHPVRYWNLLKLQDLLEKNQFETVKMFSGRNYEQMPNIDDWTFYTVAKKR